MDRNNKKFDLLIFDLDGTLFDTKWTILEALKGYVAQKGLRRLTDEEVNSFFGPPAALSFKRFFPEIKEEDFEKVLAEYRTYYIENTLLKAKPYDGTIEVLAKLKENGYKVALATYKLLRCAVPLLEHYDIIKYFDVVKGSIGELGSTKIQLMQDAIIECGIKDNNKAVMVGDTEHDFGGARYLFVPFIGMNYSGSFDNLTDEQKNYDKLVAILDKAKDILEYV